jgi:hypothetical protein
MRSVEPTQSLSVAECRDVLKPRMRELFREVTRLDEKAKLLTGSGDARLRREGMQMAAEARLLEGEANAIYWMMEILKKLPAQAAAVTADGKDAVLLAALNRHASEGEVSISLGTLSREINETDKRTRRRLGRLALAGWIEARTPRSSDPGPRYAIRQTPRPRQTGVAA